MNFFLYYCLIIFSIILLNNGVVGQPNYRTERQILSQFIKYITRNQTTNDKYEFRKIINALSFSRYVYRDSFSTYSSGRQGISCLLCRSAINSVLSMHDDGATEDEQVETMTNLCVLLGISTRRVCHGVIKLNLPIILYIYDMEPAFTAETFCGVTLQTYDRGSCSYNDKRFEWTMEIPSRNVEYQIPSQGKTSFKVIHLTDTHHDPIYEYSGLADCNEPTCCRKGQTERSSPRWKSLCDDTLSENRILMYENGSIYLDIDSTYEIREPREHRNKETEEHKKAGFWGDYRNCDSPIWTIEESLLTMSENHADADFIYYTGDMIDHGVWETTQEGITKSIKEQLYYFKSYFGDKPVFPAFGNHESQPMNQYAPDYVTELRFSTAWLYNLMVEQWSVWLPADAMETIKIGGYYTILIRPGLRVVALNSNLCYRYNWWIHLQPMDPSGQLSWLIKVLTEAELMNERVHILSHLPTGIPDCFYTYTREYKKIIERFSDVIVAEFNGHTHNDEFKIYYSRQDINKPILVAWNGGSITTYSDVNSNYRVFEVDSNSYDILDFDTWVYNLTEANLTPSIRPNWYKEYSFKEYYGLESLSLQNIDDLVQRMVTSQQDLLVKDYHIFRGKSSDPFVNRACDAECVQENLRYMTITELYDHRKFEALWDQFKANNGTKS